MNADLLLPRALAAWGITRRRDAAKLLTRGMDPQIAQMNADLLLPRALAAWGITRRRDAAKLLPRGMDPQIAQMNADLLLPRGFLECLADVLLPRLVEACGQGPARRE